MTERADGLGGDGRAPPWAGHLALSFAYRRNGTVLTRQEAALPLAFQRPLYPEGPAHCHGVVLHPPGGIANGDRLRMDIDLGRDARALLTTPGATKVYRSATEALQEVHITVAAGGWLEWLPQETILFDGARWRQRTRVDLVPGAVWLGWDITRFGRSACGERFASGNWRADTEIWRGGRPLWIDRQGLTGGSPLLETPFGLHGAAVVGTLTWLGEPVTVELGEACREWWRACAWPGEAGVTRLESGLLARYRGGSTAQVRAWFAAIWDILRRKYLHVAACPPRIWNT